MTKIIQSDGTIAKVIENPTWDDVREGDNVTLGNGTWGEEDFSLFISRVTTFAGELDAGAKPIREWRAEGFRVIQILRDSSDLLPNHVGALALTDRGTALSDGFDWGVDDYRAETVFLSNPVEALPVPAKELRILAKELEPVIGSKVDPYRASAAASDLLNAIRREWERAGIDGGLDD